MCAWSALTPGDVVGARQHDIDIAPPPKDAQNTHCFMESEGRESRVRDMYMPFAINYRPVGGPTGCTKPTPLIICFLPHTRHILCTPAEIMSAGVMNGTRPPQTSRRRPHRDL